MRHRARRGADCSQRRREPSNEPFHDQRLELDDVERPFHAAGRRLALGQRAQQHGRRGRRGLALDRRGGRSDQEASASATPPKRARSVMRLLHPALRRQRAASRPFQAIGTASAVTRTRIPSPIMHYGTKQAVGLAAKKANARAGRGHRPLEGERPCGPAPSPPRPYAGRATPSGDPTTKWRAAWTRPVSSRPSSCTSPVCSRPGPSPAGTCPRRLPRVPGTSVPQRAQADPAPVGLRG